jgi:hypothetical protein
MTQLNTNEQQQKLCEASEKYKAALTEYQGASEVDEKSNLYEQISNHTGEKKRAAWLNLSGVVTEMLKNGT